MILLLHRCEKSHLNLYWYDGMWIEELSIFRKNSRGFRLFVRTAGIPLFYGHSSVFPSFRRARLESFSRHPWVHSWTPQEHSLSFLVPNPLNYPDRSNIPGAPHSVPPSLPERRFPFLQLSPRRGNIWAEERRAGPSAPGAQLGGP